MSISLNGNKNDILDMSLEKQRKGLHSLPDELLLLTGGSSRRAVLTPSSRPPSSPILFFPRNSTVQGLVLAHIMLSFTPFTLATSRLSERFKHTPLRMRASPDSTWFWTCRQQLKTNSCRSS
ncbi:hypothetical protein BDV06DRAFT_186505 [Aspergillus oleicola]